MIDPLIWAHCVQNLLRRSNHKSSCEIKHLIRNLVPAPEQKFTIIVAIERILRAQVSHYSARLGLLCEGLAYSERLGAKVANCSSWGFEGRLLWALA